MTPIFRKDPQRFVSISQRVLARLKISTTLIVPLILVVVSILSLNGILMMKGSISQGEVKNFLSLSKVDPIQSSFKFKISKKGEFLSIEDAEGEKVAFKADQFEEFDRYFAAKSLDLTKSSLAGLTASKENLTAVLQVEQSMTYENVRPVFYALAKNRIHSVGFEVNALSYATNDQVDSNSSTHQKDFSK